MTMIVSYLSCHLLENVDDDDVDDDVDGDGGDDDKDCWGRHRCRVRVHHCRYEVVTKWVVVVVMVTCLDFDSCIGVELEIG